MTEWVATPGERAIVEEILARHLPPDTRAYVFGSRARGTTKRWADLDLSLEGDAPLSLSVLGVLRDAFDESLLPWKVDLVDRSTVSEAFGSIIDAGKVLVGDQAREGIDNAGR